MTKGKVAFDTHDSPEALFADYDLWHRVIKNVRAGIMPPGRKQGLSDEELALLEKWIKRDVFAIDPDNPDPGRVTLRRLNRIEYRNTVKDLTGVTYNTTEEFPPDDTGYGFDTIGDVLTVSPLLLEKYLQAAQSIITEAMRKPDSRNDQSRTPFRQRYFQRADSAQTPSDEQARAQQILRQFASQAFRRPVDEPTLERLTDLAERTYADEEVTFEQGIAQAMAAVLASPRFLFRFEEESAHASGEPFPLIDEYSLASRLSYLIWSTMPDEELFDLARRGELRSHLATQVQRMLKDPRSDEFVTHFTGQWLQTRDVLSVALNPRVILRRDRMRSDVELDYRLRELLKLETEAYFAHVLREDRSVLELIDSDYTFANGRLAQYYGIPDVDGLEMRRVELPADSPRGGVLTQGSVLAVTSNPTRTSPVKRGLFILENVLGTPPPPPPDNVPALESAADRIEGRRPTVRELMEIHRSNALCRSCHSRMDPLGLAFENFNALGMWRDSEGEQPIDAAGELITGEPFTGVKELKAVIRNEHASDFYRCLTEKLLTYALGRGLDHRDVHAVDLIVERLEQEEGRMSALIHGVVESAPFQKRRAETSLAAHPSPPPPAKE